VIAVIELMYRVGDANNKPILIADPNFVGTAVIGECESNVSHYSETFHGDANPYKEGESNPDGSGVNWWINQNVGTIHASGLTLTA
jgi:hypothetical protein